MITLWEGYVLLNQILAADGHVKATEILKLSPHISEGVHVDIGFGFVVLQLENIIPNGIGHLFGQNVARSALLAENILLKEVGN